MTKPTREEITGFRIRIRCTVFRTSGNTGGTIQLGIYAGGVFAEIDLDSLTVSKWTAFDLYIAPAIASWNGTLLGQARIKTTDVLTGGDAYVSDLMIEEAQISPNVPQVTAGAQYTLKMGDGGKHIYISTGGVVIPTDAQVAFPIETIVTIVNNSGSTQTISKGGTLTLNKAGTGDVTTLTLAIYGMCTLLKTGTDTWYATGAI